MMMMMIVDLYSALRRAPLLYYVSTCIVKRNVSDSNFLTLAGIGYGRISTGVSGWNYQIV